MTRGQGPGMGTGRGAMANCAANTRAAVVSEVVAADAMLWEVRHVTFAMRPPQTGSASYVLARCSRARSARSCSRWSTRAWRVPAGGQPGGGSGRCCARAAEAAALSYTADATLLEASEQHSQAAAAADRHHTIRAGAAVALPLYTVVFALGAVLLAVHRGR